MSTRSKTKNSEISANMNNLGMVMEKLAIIRWINVPFQAIISLFIILLQIPNIIGSFDYFDYELIWIPIVFGILYVFISFSTLLRFFQYLLNLWNLGKSLENSLIKKASIYQLIRIGLYGVNFILSVIIGILILIPLMQPRNYYFSIGISYYVPPPNYNLIAIAILSLVILCLIVVMKIFNTLSTVLIDNWVNRQKIKDASNEIILQLSEGTNLMKMAVFLELVNMLFGSIFYNIGLAKASQGFKKYSYQWLNNSDETTSLITSPKIQILEDKQEPMKIPPQTRNPIQTSIKNERYIKFCSFCGINRTNNEARYCFNCGSEYLRQYQ
jgi:hypothetical protein